MERRCQKVGFTPWPIGKVRCPINCKTNWRYTQGYHLMLSLKIATYSELFPKNISKVTLFEAFVPHLWQSCASKGLPLI